MTSRAALERHIQDTAVEGSPDDMRAAFRALAQWPDVPDLPDPDVVGGCRGRWFGTGPDLGVWLHGGGYVFGGSDTHAVPARYLADRIGGRVFVPDYPLAPETDWSKMADAAAAVIDALFVPHVIGDSAGGHLALALAQRGTRMNRLAVLSPNTDHSGQSRTRKINSDSDLMNDDEQDRALAGRTFGAELAAWPASLLTEDFSDCGPLFVSASLSEVLLDDSLLLVRAAALSGQQVTLRTYSGLFHMWHLWPGVLPEARQVLDDVADFLTD